MIVLSYKKPFYCVGYSQLLIFGGVIGAVIQFVDCPDPVSLLPLLSMYFENKEEKRKKKPNFDNLASGWLFWWDAWWGNTLNPLVKMTL